jgi:predicted nucleic acid-binding protein
LTGDQYAAIKVASRRQGMNLNENDLWIAATGLAMGATVVTRDSDFQAIVGLPIVDWSV